MENKEITPSQILNLKYYLLSLVLIATVVLSPIGIGLAFWKYLVVKNTKYIFTEERMKISSGVFNKIFDEIEYYRIRDYSVVQPFLYRIFGCGNISLHTSDRTHQYIILEAIKDSEELKDFIRNMVEKSRRAKGVREIDVEA